ncbi:MAG: putative DNA binding domain-containing protein [Candidatus Thiodiazotropha sp. (ex Epidulcina cf. delphinae)]|nr:putative DNA binding domain-containing protein [Candidatus Thiodiazotropha sp. (ex Epidulcina cf. delphinae)]
MLTQKELEDLLDGPESDRVERTTSTTKTDKFSEAICAFANDFPDHRQPGYLMLGVNDDGTPSGGVATM